MQIGGTIAKCFGKLWAQMTLPSASQLSMTIGSASEDEGVVLGEFKFLALQRSINIFNRTRLCMTHAMIIKNGDQLQ